jgi:histone H2A
MARTPSGRKAAKKSTKSAKKSKPRLRPCYNSLRNYIYALRPESTQSPPTRGKKGGKKSGKKDDKKKVGMSSRGMAVSEAIMEDVLRQICVTAGRLSQHVHTKRLQGRSVRSAVHLLFPHDWADINAKMENVLTKFRTDANLSVAAKKKQRHARCGLAFPLGRIARRMKACLHKSISFPAVLFTAATMDYVCKGILHVAGKCAQDNKKHRITPRHIRLASKGSTLFYAMPHCSIVGGGVIPHIHVALRKKQKK